MPAINHVCSTGSRAWRAPTAVIPGLPYFRVGAGHARDQSYLQHQVARMARSYSLEHRCAVIQRHCHLPTTIEAGNRSLGCCNLSLQRSVVQLMYGLAAYYGA